MSDLITRLTVQMGDNVAIRKYNADQETIIMVISSLSGLKIEEVKSDVARMYHTTSLTVDQVIEIMQALTAKYGKYKPDKQ